jgi:hypothetical protein
VTTEPIDCRLERKDLIAICEAAIVSCTKWDDRDTSGAQRQIGEAWALLKSGCDFNFLNDGNLKTDEQTLWVGIRFTDFSGYEDDNPDNATENFYLPTWRRLAEAKGEDWY